MLVTQILFGANVAVFLGMVLAGVSITGPTSADLIQWGANWGPLTLGGSWWRLFSCMFLHIGIIHMAFNMWCLWDLGALCESLYGHWTFAAVYLISGLAASLTSVAWHPGGVSAGASGAIFGIAGALIASYYLGEFSLPRAALSSTFRSVVLFAGYNLIFGALSGRTDNAAHVGGLAAGLVLGALIARVAPASDALGRRLGILLFGAVSIAGGTLWMQHSRSYILHATRGRELLGQHKTAEAISEFRYSIRQRPDYGPAHYALANAYFSQNQFAAAEGELNRVLDLQPQMTWARYQLGVVYLKQKRTQQARDIFAQLLAKYPHDSDAHVGMGMVLAAEENHQAAIDEYKAAAKLEESELGGLYYHLGLSYARLKMYDQAIEAYRQEQKESSDDYDTEIALANAYEAKGMQQQASDALRRAAQLKSGQ